MATIHYARLDEFWRKEEKYTFLDQHGHVGAVDWQPIAPDKRHIWLTEGMHDEFESFLPMGTKETKDGTEQNAIFQLFSNGVKTNRDSWAYNFDLIELSKNMRRMIDVYNDHVYRWNRVTSKPNIDDFVENDEQKIKWSGDLKNHLESGRAAEFLPTKIRLSYYRPFVRSYLFFDRVMNNRVYLLPSVFLASNSENEKYTICVSGVASNKPFQALATNMIPCLDLLEKTQCFPFYTYAKDGSNRRENITDWALDQFRRQYSAQSKIPNQKSQIEKWDIFHYVYALLHHPDYRAKYAANLRRELPRIPLVEDFWGFAQAGARLAELHVGYENQPEYRLDLIENPDKPLDWRVERMKLNKDKTSLVYNSFLTLAGIPPQVYDYKLGNRSALEWVIDQYQVSTDKRSSIVNDPNNPDDPTYIVRLIGQVITVSLATVQLVNGLPPLTIQPAR